VKKLFGILVCLVLLPSLLFAQEKGVISGVIVDESGEPLIEAGIEITTTGQTFYTDWDGKFRIELPEGTYELRTFYPLYQGQRVQNVVVNAGKVTRLDLSLEPKGDQEIEVVEVIVEPEKATEATQLLIRKKAAAVTDSVSAETISKQPDPDIAGVVKRQPGMSVVDDKYIIIRGLSERYSTVTLNSASLPTTEPEQRVVPMDLFPSDVVESVNIVKSYTPDLPGESTAGLVQVDTKDSPETFEIKASGKLGYNSETTGKDYLTYKGGDWDWLGYDDDTRKLPGIIPDARLRRIGIGGIGFTPEQLEKFGESFENIWNPKEKTAAPNHGGSFYIGDTIKDKFGYVFSFTYDKSYQNVEDEEVVLYRVGSGNDLEVAHDYDIERSHKDVHWTTVLNLGYKLDAQNKFSLKNLYTRKSKDEVRLYEGFNDNLRKDVRDTRLYWKEEDVYSAQLSGEHFILGLPFVTPIKGLESTITWNLSYAIASLDEPDMREVLYEFEPSIDDYTLANVTQSGSRWFTELDEDTWEGNLDWEMNVRDLIGHPLKIKFGPAASYRDRDFDHRRFRFTHRNTAGIDLTQDPETLFSPIYIDPDGFEITETTREIDSYDADHLILGNYIMADTSVYEKLRLVGGVRVEYSDQELESADPFNPEADDIQVDNEDTDWLPALNLIYSLRKDMNLRCSFSQTLDRPEFREIAPFEFTDIHGGYATVGNPDLKRALIRNYDLRWEWFLSPIELLAVSVFYKDFDDPIERVVQPTIQIRQTFQNADGADNIGFELEIRKNLGFIHHWLNPFNIFANYTYVDSDVDLDKKGSEIMTSSSRPLQGQSDHIANVVLEYQSDKWDMTARLLYNHIGERISEAGAFGLPDVYQESNDWLDLLLIKKFGKWGIKFSAKNLLDEEIEFTQGGKLYHKFKEGITASFSVFVSNI
jgi:outer membrane receptor protein involved in Fe transport